MFQDQSGEQIPAKETTEPTEAAPVVETVEAAGNMREQFVELAGQFMDRVTDELTRPERLLEAALVVFLILLAKWISERMQGFVGANGQGP